MDWACWVSCLAVLQGFDRIAINEGFDVLAGPLEPPCRVLVRAQIGPQHLRRKPYQQVPRNSKAFASLVTSVERVCDSAILRLPFAASCK